MSKTKQPTPPGEMTNIDVDFISLVRKGANKQRVQIYKADDIEDFESNNTDEVKGFMGMLKSFFVGKADETAVAKPKKSTSFAQSIAVSDIMDGMWRVNDTLREVMRNIVGDENVTDKKTSMSKAIDDYATYMKDKINSTAIAKEDYFDTPASHIEKAGRALSSRSLTSIKNAITALQSLLDDTGDNSEVQKGADDNVNSEEMTTIMKGALDEALKPITERLETLEKGDTSDSGAEGTPAGENSLAESDITEIVKAAVSEAVQPISERLDKVEKSRGISKCLENETEKSKVEKSDDIFNGFFI